MTVLDGKGRWWVAGVGLGMLLIGFGIFLLRSGLEDADRWASVVGAFLNIAGLAIAIYSAAGTRRADTFPAPHGNVDNAIRRGSFTGPVIQARDLEQVSTGSTAAPLAADSPIANRPDSGPVSNLVEDGTFSGPLIQGRDMRGVLLPAPGVLDQRSGVDG